MQRPRNSNTIIKVNRFTKLIISIAIPQFAAVGGPLVTFPSISTWYQTLNKPFFSPPNWIFAPVWTILFILMGISLFLVWDKKAKKKDIKQIAFQVFFLQLGLNFLWSLLFFYFHSPIAAFIDIIFLWLAIFLTIKHFRNISEAAAYLLVPYILWVSFAAILNLFIVILN